MKKNFCKIFVFALVALMMMSTMAFADAAIDEPAISEYVVTATITGLTAGEEATILDLKDGVTLSNEIQNSDIVYIDQLTVGDDESVTFTFDASAVVPAEPTADVFVDFYCGYTNMGDAAPLEGTALIYDYVEAPAFIYGDVDSDGEVTNTDKIMVARQVVGGYEQEINLAAADVDLDNEVTNTDKIIIARFVVGGYYDKLPVTE